MDQWEIINVINLVIAMGIINVWIIRYDINTPYRGGDSKSLKEEFTIYGLPLWFMYFVGFTKISLAILLFLGIWIQNLSFFGSMGMSILMGGAILMHLKVKDPIKKSMPAICMLIMSSLILINNFM